MKTIAIIDYGMCNLDSVAKAIEKCAAAPLVTDSKDEVDSADAIILPGVGAFADAMKELESRSLIQTIQRRVTQEQTPFLGICLGMHLMATTGNEGGKTQGLNLIPGKVVRFQPQSSTDRVPHIGWNDIHFNTKCPLLDGIRDKTDFYFVHSYHYCCDSEYVIATTPYCGNFVSVIGKGHIYGTQFHPEKSLKLGLQLLTNFIELC